MNGTTKLRIIDAHHHLWDLSEVHYPWLMDKGVKRFFGDPTPIQKNYLVNDLVNDARNFELAASVHIQVGAENSLDETRWIYKTSKGFLPCAHVADVELQAKDVSKTLDELKNYPLVKGVRQIVGRHPNEDAKNGSDLLIDDPDWQKGLSILAHKDLSFDLQLIAGQYVRMYDLLCNNPELKVAICHFASPWQLDKEAFKFWTRSMVQLSSLPNVYMKFSGFSMFKPNWTLEDIKPYILTALELFGEDRCMVGSNFPVDGLHRPYEDIFDAVYNLTGGEKFQQKLFFDNANRFYRLRL